jgi:ABC-type Na+ efflux pump permease subunit
MARKEFSDHLRSRNFLLITGILLLICTVGLVGGITITRRA